MYIRACGLRVAPVAGFDRLTSLRRADFNESPQSDLDNSLLGSPQPDFL